MKLARCLAALACCAGGVFSPHSADAQGRISGTVFDSLTTRAPLPNATVVLVERSRYVTTDARGRFTIDSLPDGHYTIGIMHPLLDTYDLQLPTVPVDITDARKVTLALATPSPSTAYSLLCPGTRDIDTGLILGRVRDVDEQSALVAATVSTEWSEYAITGGKVSGHHVTNVAHSNRDGMFLLCGVPTEIPVEIRAMAGGALAGPTTVALGEHPIARLDFALSRRDSAARDTLRADSTYVGPEISGTAALRGTLRSADGRAVRNATVSVFGKRRSTRSDSSGAFRLDGIAAGTREIDVRSLGYVPMNVVMDFATNATRDTTITIGRPTQDVKAVTVKGKGGEPSLAESSGFEKRRSQGLGRFITEEELRQHPVSGLSDVLVGAGRMKIEYTSNKYDRFPMPYLKGTKSAYCIPNYFVDDSPFIVDGALPTSRHPFTALSDAVHPESIKGIEIYSAPGTIPAQYDLTSSTGCGSVVIWTR